MFRNTIEIIPPFSREAIDKHFWKSNRFFDNDYSFEMTSVILFYNRKPDFHVDMVSCDTDGAGAVNRIKESNTDHFTFLFLNCFDEPDEFLKDSSLKDEYTSLPKLELFAEKELSKKVYVRRFEKLNTVAFYTRSFDIQLYHVFQSLIPLYFPSIFADNPVTKEEKEFLFTLMNQRDTTYRKAVEQFLGNEDLKRFLLRNQLLGFEKTLRQRKYEAAVDVVKDFEHQMEQCLRNYQNYWAQRQDAQVTADGLKYAVEQTEDETEFEDYICENKHLTNISLSNEGISFVIKTFVDPYLPDDWDSLSNRGTIFEGYKGYNEVVGEKENLKLLLDAIFSRNHSLKLKICGYINMNFRRGWCESQTGYNYVQADPNLRDYIPNGHLQEFNCFGQNKTEILAAMSEGDTIGAVECCINVVRRENVSERATFSPFVKTLVKCKGKCIVSEEDGSEMTPEQAIEYLKEKMNNEAASELAGEEVPA